MLELTGPGAITAAELAATLGEITGRPVRHRPQSDDEFVATMISYGQPTATAQIFAAANRAIREGWLSQVTDLVQRISGRRPTSVTEFLANHRSALVRD